MRTQSVNQSANEKWVLAATVLASSMAFIDATALNVALPAIQSQLGATATGLMWIVNSYAVVTAALILFGGGLGDRFGRKRIFANGIGIFVAASLGCGLARSTEFLILARTLQGLGAACMIPGSLSLISTTFEPARRGRAIGIWSAFSVVFTALGPILGGLLADHGLWRAVFYINLPIGALALAVLLNKVSVPSRHRMSPSLDYVGATFSICALAGFNFSLLEAASRGWRDPLVIIAFLGGLGFLIAFLYCELKSKSPLLPLELFRNRDFSAACQLTICLYSGFYGMLFFLALNLIQVQNYQAWLAGAAQLPVMLLVIVISPMAGSLVDRYGPRGPLAAGGTLAMLGFLLLARPGLTSDASQYWVHFFPPLLLLGAAMGFSAAPLSTTIMNSVPESHVGIASGINSTLSRLSSVLGIAVLGPIAIATFRRSLLLQTESLALNDNHMRDLQLESWRLADAVAPSGMSSEMTQAVEQLIRLAYVDSFRVVSFVSAGIVGLSTLLAAAILKRNHSD